MNRIAYQGIEGSFSHLTAKRFSSQLLGLPTFQAVYEAVEKGEADFALMPIENTLAGTIYETIDLLNQGDLKIVGMTQTKIEHSLMALPGAEPQRVKSHPKALMQCTRFLAENPHLEAISYFDTAGAAANLKDLSTAAIAHSSAAKIYGLEILAQNIQDHEENYTRFFLIGKRAVEGKKASLCFTLDHRPGSLADVLTHLAGANLTYIVSRPIIGKPFEYMFYVDLESIDGAALEELQKKTNSLKVFGKYDVLS
ncbi:MAG: bifunctional chorismate mutase/prephenate dehydratase [Verrucomicrobia bacterium]|nr:bifunctional chorismate mutase/prephenate dehydratase [Verrucomicrobiota bacterium]